MCILDRQSSKPDIAALAAAGMASAPLTNDHHKFVCRVSSTLNRDVKAFGKKHLFDGIEDTCWNSDQGLPQWISLEFEAPASVDCVEMQFQGGFVGSDCALEGREGEDQEWRTLAKFYPEDNNKLQRFQITCRDQQCRQARIVFSSSTDFYGRITVYKLGLFGRFDQ